MASSAGHRSKLNAGAHTKKTEPPEAQTLKDDLMMKLSPELRNRIYEGVLISMDPMVYKRTDISTCKSDTWQPNDALTSWTFVAHSKPTIPKSTGTIFKPYVVEAGKDGEPGILRVSQQIRNEALMMYYHNNTFEMRMNVNDIERAIKWLSCVRSRCENANRGDDGPAHYVPFQRLNIVIEGIVYGDLQALAPLAQMAHLCGPGLLRRAQFQLEGQLVRKYPTKTLQYPFRMGLRSWKAKWSPERVQQKINMWMRTIRVLHEFDEKARARAMQLGRTL